MRILAMTSLAILTLAAFSFSTPTASAGLSQCFSQVDDLITDGGTTYCIDPNGNCKVSESTEYIWGREYRCVVN